MPLVELDAVASMSLPTLLSWEDAHRVFEATVTQWLGADLSVVIAEGSGRHPEVNGLKRTTPAPSRVVVVATTTTDIAHARAQHDPDRGMSRDRTVLERAYAAWPAELELMSPDLTLDTSVETLHASVGQLRAFLASFPLRTAPRDSHPQSADGVATAGFRLLPEGTSGLQPDSLEESLRISAPGECRRETAPPQWPPTLLETPARLRE